MSVKSECEKYTILDSTYSIQIGLDSELREGALRQSVIGKWKLRMANTF